LAVLGAFSYLPKPFGTADLLRAVTEALRMGSPTPSA
jgi:DNA-binding response OmpR family regulator